jgi:predicted ATPase/DNA-binding CsgD family transcriptional regulator
VSELMKAAPGIRVLATSREPLDVAGEHVLRVPPLELPSPHPRQPLDRLRQNEAVMLFVERAAAAAGSFELTAANQAAVTGLCRRLDGLPLAIELAAVRTRTLSAEQIHDRLSDRFGLLTGGSRAALPRHQTLRATIEWSYGLLTPAEQALLTRLCVFAGRFTLEDVEPVCCYGDVPPAHALNLLSSLIGKSLVSKEEIAGGACYRLHETMREYARMKLREACEEDAVERRCADYYLSRCAQFAVEGRYRLLPWLAWTELRIDNIRAVLRRCAERGDFRRGISIATCLIWYWSTRATTEGARWLDELLAGDSGGAVHPWANFVRGLLAVLQNDPAAASPALARAAPAARTVGQPGVLSNSLALASIAANMAGDHAYSRRLLDEALVAAQGQDELGTRLLMCQAQALNGLLDGDIGAVRSAADDGALLSREAGDLYTLGMMLLNQGFAALGSGAQRAAGERFAEGLRIARQHDDRVAQCHLLGGLACCAAGSREPRLAARLLGATESLRTEAGASINAGMAPALAKATTSVTAALGPVRFATEFNAGRQLSRDAAARLALGEPAAAAAAAADHDGAGILGQRETEVARLVAEGLSNKEIGARLFISERTVDSHVRNILNKLGFGSRAQIAGWVARLSL